jgi:hypothetical protein
MENGERGASPEARDLVFKRAMCEDARTLEITIPPTSGKERKAVCNTFNCNFPLQETRDSRYSGVSPNAKIPTANPAKGGTRAPWLKAVWKESSGTPKDPQSAFSESLSLEPELYILDDLGVLAVQSLSRIKVSRS